MSTPRRITQEDLTLYAMQLLSYEEAAEVAGFLEQSAEARRELERIQGDLAVYAYSVDVHAPAPMVKDRLLKQVAKERRTAPAVAPVATPISAPVAFAPPAAASVEAPVAAPVAPSAKVVQEEPVLRLAPAAIRSEPPVRGSSTNSLLADTRLTEDDEPKRNVAKVFAWIGWAVAAGLAVGAGELYRERLTLQTTIANQTAQMEQLTTDAATAREALNTLNDPAALRVTLSKGKEAPVPQGRVTYVADKGTLIFLANNLEPLAPFKTYELWLIPATAGQEPIPAGIFHPDQHGNASVILPTLPKGVAAKAFGVTIEDKDGATTPTLPIILVGA